MRRPMPIGIEDYKEMIEEGYCYVDKTLLIRDLLKKKGKVNLFTRPRRFGKTLALTMLKTFFEAEVDENGEKKDNANYFRGMKIAAAGSEYIEHMGRYPVIFLSLKSAGQPDYQSAKKRLEEEIAEEFKRHRYVLMGKALMISEKKRYEEIMNRQAGADEYTVALKFLSQCLAVYHKEKTVILIDEYDVPLENAYFCNFYDEMTDFIRPLFESALKTNENLKLAVITGCLRISKESIFTGLNNLKINSVLSAGYAEYFGFTAAETMELLEMCGLKEKEEEVKEWYDGYLFGKTEVYNPWSILNYLDEATENKDILPKPYWANTSSNSIVKELVENAEGTVRQEMEELIAGKCIEKPIHEDITYEDIYSSQENLWNFLLFTGYLRAVKPRLEGDAVYLKMKVPNREICYIYKNIIQTWFEKKIKGVDFEPFYNALLHGEKGKVEEFINAQLLGSISYFDSEEKFYHGYMMGILAGLGGYQIYSNREEGIGRPDILLHPLNYRKPAIIIELKHVKTFPQMETGCREALAQIEERGYAAGLEAEGCSDVLKYGICFCRKSCMVK